MNVLNFLFISDYNLLAIKLIDYLIDAGHYVYLVTNENNKQWLNNYTHGLQLLDSKEIDSENHDYVIDFTNTFPTTDIPHLDFNLNIADNEVISHVMLSNSKKTILLSEIQTNFYYNAGNNVIDEIDHLYDEVLEGFIDAIILLLRNAYDDLPTETSNNGNTIFSQILIFEQQVTKLYDYYLNITQTSDSIFNLTDLLPVVKNTLIPGQLNYNNNKKQFIHENEHKNNSPELNSKFDIIKEFTTSNYKLSLSDIELLTIYLSMLLNARQNSTYHYELIVNDKKISKYSQIESQSNYVSIINELQNEVYNVINNPYYVFHGFANYISKIAIIFDSVTEINTDNYLLVLQYNPSTQSLRINYHNALYFFDKLEEYISYFYEQKNNWQKNNLPINSILYNDINLYYDQICILNNTDKEYPEDKTIYQLFEE